MLSLDPQNVPRPTSLSEAVEVVEVEPEVEGLLEGSLDEDETPSLEILLRLVDRKRTTTRWTEKVSLLLSCLTCIRHLAEHYCNISGSGFSRGRGRGGSRGGRGGGRGGGDRGGSRGASKQRLGKSRRN